ncbi:histidine kinase [Novosphingobium sp. KCTC 2891]|uniref:sensor histidine kinase n=1 Tax=Novosphingobium sp. KCTC 2891 TaxID=2989730 RepID=UPI0022224591|nr:histidine kinase [Novosphingobium sp. KCTC 2891]MCW1381314.1 histidine kinase [Novosphingobium sp. KCTC 2891]
MTRAERNRMFMRRTGKILATSRAILAFVFLLAVLVDPGQPARSATIGLAILSGYLMLSAALVILAWESWWYEFRLARLVHVLDIAAFIAGVYFTETGSGDFASPFMAFAAFLLVTASLRWGWTGIALTALGLLAANTLVGGALYYLHLDLDIYRFGRRQIYMVVLSIMMVWLSSDQRLLRPVQLPEPPGIPGERRIRVMAEALVQVRKALRARGAAIALLRNEEPFVDVVRDFDDVCTHTLVGPGALAEDLAQQIPPTLFDTARHRRIASVAGVGLVATAGPISVPLAAHCEITEAILVSISTATGQGQLLVWGIPDLCVDDLPSAGAFAREIGLALDREEMASLAQDAAVSGIRNALARDLHDSVAQFLAGTLFRIEALRRWIREGNDPDGEINAIKEALRREQTQLRTMIDRLRRGEDGDRRTDLVEELQVLLVELAHHWHIETRLDSAVSQLPVSIQLAYELRQLVREGVANAARHGHCSQVTVSIAGESESLRLRISDDGDGFPKDRADCRPRSISERVEALGGRLDIADNLPGALLDIALPARIAA